MPFVNFVKEHIGFMEYAADRGLSSNERLLYYALLHIFNQRANGGAWPDGYIPISVDRLMTYLPCGYNAMARARNALVQHGLLSYRKGNKNADAPMYQLHYLTVAREAPPEPENWGSDAQRPEDTGIQETESDDVNLRFCLQNGGKSANRPVENHVDNSVNLQFCLQNGDKTANNNKLNKTYIKDEEDEEEGACARASSSNSLDNELPDDRLKLCADSGLDELETAARRAIRENFGREGTPAECRRLAIITNILALPVELLEAAISMAALQGASSRLGYTTTVLHEMDQQEIRTLAEWDEYRQLKDWRDGRIDGVRHNVSDQMEATRLKRRAKHAAMDRGGAEGWPKGRRCSTLTKPWIG